LAKMTGPRGTVYCVDIQDKMLAKLQQRANKYDVSNIIKPLQIGKDYHVNDLHGKLDFVLLFAVVHEVPDKTELFNNIFAMLKPGGKIVFAEPKGHVSPDDFEKSIAIARTAGFRTLTKNPMAKGLSVFLVR